MPEVSGHILEVDGLHVDVQAHRFPGAGVVEDVFEVLQHQPIGVTHEYVGGVNFAQAGEVFACKERSHERLKRLLIPFEAADPLRGVELAEVGGVAHRLHHQEGVSLGLNPPFLA